MAATVIAVSFVQNARYIKLKAPLHVVRLDRAQVEDFLVATEL
jgi:hypothetical protein